MYHGFNIKKITTAVLSAVLIYFIITVILQFLSYGYKNEIEKKTAGLLQNGHVSIGSIFNLPFVSLTFNNVEIGYGKSSGTIERITFYYNPFRYILKGPARSVYHISLGKIKINSGSSEAAEAWRKLRTNSFTGIIQDITISGRYADISISLISNINSDFNIGKYSLKIINNKLDIDLNISSDLHLGTSVGYLTADLIFLYRYDFDKRSGSGKIHFNNVNIGGARIADGEDAYFTSEGKIIPDLEKSFLSKTVKNENGTVYYSIERDIRIDYARSREYFLLDYIFPDGNYHFNISFYTNENVQGFEIGVGSKTDSNRMRLDLEKKGDNWAARGDIESSRIGRLKTDLLFGKDSIFPEGTVFLRNFSFIQFLDLSGEYHFENSGGRLRITGDNVSINGGPIGNVYTEASSVSNSLLFTSGFAGANVLMNGFIKGGKYDLLVDALDIPGEAIVSNIGFDLLRVGKGRFSGKLRIFNDAMGGIELAGHVKGYDSGLKKGDKNFAVTSISFNSNVLSFRGMNFTNEGIRADFDLAFGVSNRNGMSIDLSGRTMLQDRFTLPLSGRVFINGDDNASTTEILVDNGIKINAESGNDASSIDIYALRYPLSRIGSAGTLNMKYSLSLTNGRIDMLNMDAQYSNFNRVMRLYADVSRTDGYLSIDRLLLDLRDDHFIGHGKLYQMKGGYYGQVDFDRKGSLYLSLTDDSIYGNFLFHDFLIKNIFKDALDVLVSGKLSFSGDLLNPDVTGNLNIVNSENSEKFSLDIPSLKLEDGEWAFDGIILKMADYKADFNLSYEHGGQEQSVWVNGRFNMDDVIKAEGSFDYIIKTNRQDLYYNIRSLALSERVLSNISGLATAYSNNNYSFIDNNNRGFNGYYRSSGKTADWDISFLNRSIYAGSSGAIRSNFIRAGFNLRTPLDVISGLGFIKDVKGDADISLSLDGDVKKPSINGKLHLSIINAEFNEINTRVKNLNTDLLIVNNRMLLTNIILITPGGNFNLDGSIYFNNLSNPYFDMSVKALGKDLPSIAMNINDQRFKISGKLLIKELKIDGGVGSLNISGDAGLENMLIYLSGFGLSASSGNSINNSFINNIKWKIPIRIGSGVKFSNEFIDIFLRKDDVLTLQGALADNTLNLKGNIGVDRGTLSYLGRDFSVIDGKAVFQGNPGDLIPYVQLDSSYKYRDENGSPVEVFLTFSGKADNIVLSSFSSIPTKSTGELSAILGLQSQNEVPTISNMNSGGGFVPGGVSMAAENAFIFSPLTIDLRRRLGLDLFTIRTGIIDNWARREIFGETYINNADIFEGSTISLGKYIIPDIYLQYDLIISRNPLAVEDLIPLQSFGLDLDLRLFDLGWKIQPFTELGKQVLYEQFFELNVNQKF